ncbi:membrane-associated guanylate kinase, WW and PDZ domain-containing protein 1 isoform X2 [Venturia canescens]|uniref:membrane-associated guanylate kinase, WW and PDZ domain-containing protein 1 isoform X2 n=1 Tax=Venturia canescens TaxID=32260 RepID=UPI001C9C94E4|nr:membrane-associated guanylate kinase, WW and PDZ domain-containing protein 1 isoform X2 [Venturia canescens]
MLRLISEKLRSIKMENKTEDSVSLDNTNDVGSVDKEMLAMSDNDMSSHRVPPNYMYNTGSEQVGGNMEHDMNGRCRSQASEDQLGPLPQNWEKAYTDTGEVYFIDHNTGTSHWLDPRLSKFQKRSLEECLDDELPYGWEKIDDQLYGTYFIDHVNRRTQYENPVLQAKRAQQSMNDRKSPNFTRNPKKLKGQRVRTTLLKSSRGLGFTIVGGDDAVEEFLQIKSVAPNGPAWLDGKLQTGDVLVYVNETCVLGFTHNEMVNVFKSIGSGETVTLEVCRGYPLPFDPNDPNTEVVTTIAVSAPGDQVIRDAGLLRQSVHHQQQQQQQQQQQHHQQQRQMLPGSGDRMVDDPSLYMDLDSGMQRNEGRFDFLDTGFLSVHNMENGDNLANTSVNSMPDLCISEKMNGANAASIKRPSSTDILLSDTGDDSSVRKENSSPISTKSEFLSISIVKGAMGFGFTIADSSHGQKVKKILDRQRCKNLMEGDILVNINEVTVRNMCHSEVVQVLKDCPRNQEAMIHVQRTTSVGNSSMKDVKRDKQSQDFFRSKTPTADIYSTQSKTVVPSRPKTPLIDTRTCAKSPSNDANWPEQTCDNDLNHLDNRYKYSDYNRGIYYTDPYKANIANMTENFGPMTNLDDVDDEDDDEEERRQNVRHASLAKRDWVVDDKMGLGNDVYSVNVAHHDNIIKHNGSGVHPDYYKDLYASQTHPRYNEQDYSAYTIGQEQNVDTGEIWDKRKETTSFEHEQPHSSSVSRFPQYGGEMVCPTIPDIEWIETLVTLVRQDTGFGFRIVGGTEEGSQVSVGHIVPGGAADRDNRLNTGDLIMSVDGESVMNSSHHNVVQLMIGAAQNGRVTLGIRRRINAQDHLRDNLQTSYGRQINIQYPYDVTVTRMENEGFGFVIISSVNKAGSTIGRIIEGSPAERCGRLNVGDHILAVNHVDITNVCHKDIVNLIKDSGYSVTLTIGYPLDDCCSNTSLSQKDEPAADGDGGQYHAVELTRGTRGFGFSIRGGREFQNMPLFVLQIAENGPAAVDNRLRVGDQIIEINAINTKNMTHTEAIEIIRNGGPSVRLLIRRGCQMPTASNLTIDQISIRPIEPGNVDEKLKNSHGNCALTEIRRKKPFSIPLSCCCSSRKRR